MALNLQEWLATQGHSCAEGQGLNNNDPYGADAVREEHTIIKDPITGLEITSVFEDAGGGSWIQTKVGPGIGDPLNGYLDSIIDVGDTVVEVGEILIDIAKIYKLYFLLSASPLLAVLAMIVDEIEKFVKSLYDMGVHITFVTPEMIGEFKTWLQIEREAKVTDQEGSVARTKRLKDKSDRKKQMYQVLKLESPKDDDKIQQIEPLVEKRYEQIGITAFGEFEKAYAGNPTNTIQTYKLHFEYSTGGLYVNTAEDTITALCESFNDEGDGNRPVFTNGFPGASITILATVKITDLAKIFALLSALRQLFGFLGLAMTSWTPPKGFPLIKEKPKEVPDSKPPDWQFAGLGGLLPSFNEVIKGLHGIVKQLQGMLDGAVETIDSLIRWMEEIVSYIKQIVKTIKLLRDTLKAAKEMGTVAIHYQTGVGGGALGVRDGIMAAGNPPEGDISFCFSMVDMGPMVNLVAWLLGIGKFDLQGDLMSIYFSYIKYLDGFREKLNSRYKEVVQAWGELDTVYKGKLDDLDKACKELGEKVKNGLLDVVANVDSEGDEEKEEEIKDYTDKIGFLMASLQSCVDKSLAALASSNMTDFCKNLAALEECPIDGYTHLITCPNDLFDNNPDELSVIEDLLKLYAANLKELLSNTKAAMTELCVKTAEVSLDSLMFITGENADKEVKDFLLDLAKKVPVEDGTQTTIERVLDKDSETKRTLSKTETIGTVGDTTLENIKGIVLDDTKTDLMKASEVRAELSKLVDGDENAQAFLDSITTETVQSLEDSFSCDIPCDIVENILKMLLTNNEFKKELSPDDIRALLSMITPDMLKSLGVDFLKNLLAGFDDDDLIALLRQFFLGFENYNLSDLPGAVLTRILSKLSLEELRALIEALPEDGIRQLMGVFNNEGKDKEFLYRVLSNIPTPQWIELHKSYSFEWLTALIDYSFSVVTIEYLVAQWIKMPYSYLVKQYTFYTYEQLRSFYSYYPYSYMKKTLTSYFLSLDENGNSRKAELGQLPKDLLIGLLIQKPIEVFQYLPDSVLKMLFESGKVPENRDLLFAQVRPEDLAKVYKDLFQKVDYSVLQSVFAKLPDELVTSIFSGLTRDFYIQILNSFTRERLVTFYQSILKVDFYEQYSYYTIVLYKTMFTSYTVASVNIDWIPNFYDMNYDARVPLLTPYDFDHLRKMITEAGVEEVRAILLSLSKEDLLDWLDRADEALLRDMLSGLTPERLKELLRQIAIEYLKEIITCSLVGDVDESVTMKVITGLNDLEKLLTILERRILYNKPKVCSCLPDELVGLIIDLVSDEALRNALNNLSDEMIKKLFDSLSEDGIKKLVDSMIGSSSDTNDDGSEKSCTELCDLLGDILNKYFDKIPHDLLQAVFQMTREQLRANFDRLIGTLDYRSFKSILRLIKDVVKRELFIDTISMNRPVLSREIYANLLIRLDEAHMTEAYTNLVNGQDDQYWTEFKNKNTDLYTSGGFENWMHYLYSYMVSRLTSTTYTNIFKLLKSVDENRKNEEGYVSIIKRITTDIAGVDTIRTPKEFKVPTGFAKAGGVRFTDESRVAGKIKGNVLIERAIDESDVTAYNLYWGATKDVKVSTETMIGSVPKTGASLTYVIGNELIIPEGAKYIIVFTENNGKEAFVSEGVRIIDKTDGATVVSTPKSGVPVNKPRAVGFFDVDVDSDELSGVVEILRPRDESDVDFYEIYFGLGSDIYPDTSPLVRLNKTGENIFHRITSNTKIPQSPPVTTLLVFAGNATGLNPSPVIANISGDDLIYSNYVLLEVLDEFPVETIKGVSENNETQAEILELIMNTMTNEISSDNMGKMLYNVSSDTIHEVIGSLDHFLRTTIADETSSEVQMLLFRTVTDDYLKEIVNKIGLEKLIMFLLQCFQSPIYVVPDNVKDRLFDGVYGEKK